MSGEPQWLMGMYMTWGDQIHEEDLSRYGVMKLIGMGEHRSRTLVNYVRSNGPPSKHTPEQAEPDQEPVVEASGSSHEWVHDANYYYNEQTDTYVTFIKSSPKPLVVPGTVHKAMKAAYSNWDGLPASVNQICRDFNIPRPWFIEYKQIHGWTHDSEPFTAEEIMSRPMGELVSDALQQRRRMLYQKYEKSKWNDIKSDAAKWMQFETEVLSRLEASIQMHAPQYTVPRLRLSRADREFAVVTSATDFHWGKYAWGEETGESYNRQIAEKRLRDATEDLLARLPGQPEKMVLAVGSDWFHVDGDTATTTKGTPQDVDGTPTEIFITGCEIARLHVDLLRQVAPVEIVLMAGNHDRANCLALLLYLSAWFKDAADVTVHMDYKPRVYLRYGDTLMGFHHGDMTPVDKLGTCMAHEAKSDWGETSHHVCFGGHQHHQVVKETGGIIYYQMPSLAGHDRWHTRKGYVDSKAGLNSYIVDKQRGVVATYFSPVQHEE